MGRTMTTLITNIGMLVNVREQPSLLRGKDLAVLPVINNAYLLIEDERIREFGSMSDLDLNLLWPPKRSEGGNLNQTLDAKGGCILPAWCDSHTHIVYPASREEEFVDKILGASYAEIAAKGGGILNSARRLNEMPEEQLYQLAMDRLKEVAALGTGAIEIKSGYGLSVEGELKMLRVIKRLKKD